MGIALVCFNCGKHYTADVLNTKIVGPIIETQCPFCGKLIEKGFSSFIVAQTKKIVRGRSTVASTAIAFAQALEHEVVEDT